MSRTSGTVRLTFDDGPDPVWTPRILDALDATSMKATFFVIAPLALEYPELVRRALDRGHEVAFHCERHVRHTELSDFEIHEDTRRGMKALAGLGVSATEWRPPWGICAGATGKVAAKFGLDVTLWTSDTRDWRGDSSAEMLRAITPDLSDGAVILMHDGLGPGARRDGCRETVGLIPPLANRLRDLDLEPATAITEKNDPSPETVERLGGWISTPQSRRVATETRCD